MNIDFINKIILGDALKLLPKIESDSVGIVVTDPPFYIPSERNLTRKRNPAKFSKDASGDEWDIFDNKEDFLDFTDKWLNEAVRILRPGGILCSWFDKDKINFISDFVQDSGFKLKGYCSVCKTNPVPQSGRTKWMSGWEMFGLWAKPGAIPTYNYQLGQHPDYFFVPIVGGKERTKHPTQKSLKVVKDIIAYWSNKEDIVLDPFVGSGTTVIAAKVLGRKFIAFEKNQEYFDIAIKRNEDNLFGG